MNISQFEGSKKVQTSVLLNALKLKISPKDYINNQSSTSLIKQASLVVPSSPS